MLPGLSRYWLTQLVQYHTTHENSTKLSLDELKTAMSWFRKRVPIIADLSNWGVLAVCGNKAKTFLQGQLTQNMDNVSTREANMACYLTPQGRVLTNLIIFAVNDTVYYCLLPRLLIPTITEKLTKVAMLSKVSISDLSQQYYLMATLHSPSSFTQAWEIQYLFDNLVNIRLSNTDLTLHLIPSEKKALAIEHFTKTHHLANHFLWQLACIHAQIPLIEPETSGIFTVHDLNLQKLAVSFQKGCYTGQEIVARTEYKATLKQHLYLISLQVDLSMNQPLYDESKNEIGRVINIVYTGEDYKALTLLKDIIYEKKQCYLQDGKVVEFSRVYTQSVLNLGFTPFQNLHS